MNKATTRVLLIDGGMHNLESIQVFLESQGMQVRLYIMNGKTPDPKVFSNMDIIIFDSGNLTTEGYRHCASIRRSSHIPLLVLSTFNQPNIVANMLDFGADDFLTKPVSTEMLIAHIKKLTRRTAKMI